MMQAITRYIFNQLLIAVIFITVGLTLVVWLSQSLRFIDYIVNRGLPATTFLSFVALLLPSFLGIVMPIATFCAVLFIYHKLIMDSELVVLRSAGLSQLQLARPALVLSGLVTLAVYSIMIYFLPVSYRAFKDLQSNIRADYSTVLLQEGTFNIISDGITVYVRERSANGELRGILYHDNRNPKKPITRMAEHGILVHSDSGLRVVMANGNISQVENEEGRFSLLSFDRWTFELAQIQAKAGTRWREPRERFLPDLLNPPLNEHARNELIAEGHQRLVGPLYCLAFAMVGLAVLLSGQFNRRGHMWRVLFAIFVVAALEALSLALHDLASRTPVAIPAMYAGAIVPVLASAFVLLWAPRRRMHMLGAEQVS